MAKYSIIRIISLLFYSAVFVIVYLYNNIIIMLITGISIIPFDMFLTPYLKDLKEQKKKENKIKRYFNEIQDFLSYLYSEKYKNQNPQTSNNDERLIVDLSMLKDKEKELKKYFCFMIRKDEPSKHKKQLSILWGKWMVHFRIHKPFESSLYLNEKLGEEDNIEHLKELLLNDMKNYAKKKFKIII